ncbi:MAG: type II secretion system F family protein [Bdellovibrionales bacterium]|nr:type II secretion system F family protein [Bdellovibrionales bacterium]
MPVYIYHAEKGGELLKGTLKARSVSMVNQYLKSKNLDPVYVVEKPLLPFQSGVKRVKNKELMQMTRQLSFLLSSGVSLLQALDMLSTSMSGSSPHFKRSLLQIRGKLEAGSSFSRALKGYPHIFSAFYVNMIACSEETGLMDQVLTDLANYMEKIEAIKSKVKSPMIYIAIVLFISVCITGGIIVFVVPTFETLYAGSGGQLPALTQSLVDLSHLIRNKWYLFLAGLIGIPVFIKQYLQTDQGKQTASGIISALPVLGGLQYKGDLARFCRSFETLLRSGVNFLEALDVGRKLVSVKKVKEGLRVARKAVSTGKSFGKGLGMSKVFPQMMVGMTSIGEESGKLSETYKKLADFYEKEVDALVSGLVKMIEPVMITVLGAIIGTLILALYLPIFKMGEAL